MNNKIKIKLVLLKYELYILIYNIYKDNYKFTNYRKIQNYLY